MGCYVWRDNDRQVERDLLDRLSNLSVAVGEDKRDVYTLARDVQLVEQAKYPIRIKPVWDSTGIISFIPIRISRQANCSAYRRSTRGEVGCTMLNRNLSQKRGLTRLASQGFKDLIPLHRRSLGWNAQCLLFRRLTGYSRK